MFVCEMVEIFAFVFAITFRSVFKCPGLFGMDTFISTRWPLSIRFESMMFFTKFISIFPPETKGKDHINEIYDVLEKEGYEVIK